MTRTRICPLCGGSEVQAPKKIRKVVDVDPSGRIIVEEVAAPMRSSDPDLLALIRDKGETCTLDELREMAESDIDEEDMRLAIEAGIVGCDYDHSFDDQLDERSRTPFA